MLYSTQANTYQRMLDDLDATMQALQTKRAQLQAAFNATQCSDVLERDQAWLSELSRQPKDWAALLCTKTTSEKWRQEVQLAGVSGGSEWVQVQERAITLEFYKEMPERIATYQTLLEQVFPAMTPWPNGNRCVSVRTEGTRMMLGVDSDGEYFLVSGNTSNQQVYPDLKSALWQIQRQCAKSYFSEPY